MIEVLFDWVKWSAFAILTLYLFNHFYWKRRGLPPGPTPFPIFGNLNSLSCRTEHMLQVVQRWQKKYGDLYTIWLFNTPAIFVNDYDLLRELFVTGKTADHLLGRARQNDALSDDVEGEYGINHTEGERWRANRKFAVHTLRGLGFGRTAMEDKIVLEVGHFFEFLRQNEGKPINPTLPITRFVGNIINQFISGFRFPDEKNVAVTIREQFEKLDDITKDPLLIFGYWPLLRRLPRVKRVVEDALKLPEMNKMFIREQIAEHRRRAAVAGHKEDDGEPEDFITACLQEMRRREQLGESSEHNAKQLETAVYDIWEPALITSTETLRTIFLYLIHYPEYQQKCQEEIDRALGREHEIRMNDRTQLPFTSALIVEVQRCLNLLPINIARAVTEDIWIKDYYIPKRTLVFPQVSAVLCDPRYYPEPEKFDPNRFIDEEGKLKKDDHLLLFSIGKRRCLGETLAKTELFVLVASVLQRFTVSKVPGQPFPSIQKKIQFSVSYPAYECVFKARH